MLWIAVSAVAFGLWRSWDGSGTYLRGGYRVAICGALAAMTAWPGFGQAWPEYVVALWLAAGVTYALQRGFDDWSDPQGIAIHFAQTSLLAIFPWAVWRMIADPTPAALIPVGLFGLVCTASGLAYAYEGKAFGRLPMPRIGKVQFDPHRWAEAVNGAVHGAMLAIVAHAA